MSAIANFFSGLLGSNQPTTTNDKNKPVTGNQPTPTTNQVVNAYNGPMLGGKRRKSRKAARKNRKASRKSRKSSRKSASRKNTRRTRK